jgi:hypothetical protein
VAIDTCAVAEYLQKHFSGGRVRFVTPAAIVAQDRISMSALFLVIVAIKANIGYLVL